MSLTITADLSTISGSEDAGYAVFTLVGFGDLVPTASEPAGSGGHIEVILSTLSCKALANDVGLISQVLLGNDIITPPNTTYVVTIYSDLGGFISEGRYSLVGSGTKDLSTLTQIS
jgi:hypothetical protein